jgi:fused signal recognition particle receptor
VVLVLGVNGSGKTTSLAKIARRLREQGRSVVLAAGDTFRAAAIEQLEIWAERIGAKLIKHQPGADPGAVAYDAVEYALHHDQDVVLIDTAGRLHTKHNLMEELKKIRRVVEKRLGREVDERLLVLDATIGQNALAQAQTFHEAVPLTGLVITKLDGTAKGGVIVPIAKELQIPIKFIGVGETAEDLREFRAREFVEALLA